MSIVKLLEWEEFTHDGGAVKNGVSGRFLRERALYPFGAYFIEQDTDDDSWWAVRGLVGKEIDGPFEHDWQARASVEEYHNTSVLSALDPAYLDRVKQLEEALRQARDFIADEYRDPSRELVGDWIAKEARPVFDNICTALGDANAPR